MMARAFHYNLDVSLLLQYLGSNYTKEHIDVQETTSILLEYDIPCILIQHYIQVMLVGCPVAMIVLQYWREGDNLSIKKNLTQVKKTTNKEDKNKLPSICLVSYGTLFHAYSLHHSTC